MLLQGSKGDIPSCFKGKGFSLKSCSFLPFLFYSLDSDLSRKDPWSEMYWLFFRLPKPLSGLANESIPVGLHGHGGPIDSRGPTQQRLS